MTLFEEIVADILAEDVQIGKVNDAISRTYEVKITYLSDDDVSSGERIIQPVAYGLTKTGKPAIRAYQPFGDTQTSVPSWKLFLLSGIQQWEPLFDNIFRTPPGNFNPHDDKGMSTVYQVANFWKAPEEQASMQPTPVKTSGPVKKNDIENNHISYKDNPEVKKLEKLRKQLDNPRYISDIIKNKTFGTDSGQNNNSHMVANSGPVSKNEHLTQTEKDITNSKEQMNKNEKISQDVLNQLESEREKRNNIKNYARNWN